MEISRLSRCLNLLHLLQPRMGFKVEDLARETGVSKRTIFRDLNALKDAGIDVHFDERFGSHCVETDYPINVSRLQREDLEFLVVAVCSSNLTIFPKARERLLNSLAKLVTQAPSFLREDLEALVRSCSSQPCSNKVQQLKEDVLENIVAALSRGKKLRVTFTTEVQYRQTKITPFRLVATSGSWQLVGRSSWHRLVLRIGLHNIAAAEVLEEDYETPRRFRMAAFSGKHFILKFKDYEELLEDHPRRDEFSEAKTRLAQVQPLLKPE